MKVKWKGVKEEKKDRFTFCVACICWAIVGDGKGCCCLGNN